MGELGSKHISLRLLNNPIDDFIASIFLPMKLRSVATACLVREKKEGKE
jgi:hypothetical protein